MGVVGRGVRAAIVIVVLVGAGQATPPGFATDDPGPLTTAPAAVPGPNFALRQVDSPSLNVYGAFGTALTAYAGRTDVIVVGAPRTMEHDCPGGNAYVYERLTTGWTFRKTVPSFQYRHGCGFGQSFAWSGETLFGGWHGHAYSRGGLEVFKAPSSWRYLEARNNPLGASGSDYDTLGWSLAMVGGFLAAGAPNAQNDALWGSPTKEHVYLYRYDPPQYPSHKNWVSAGRFAPAEWTGYDHFGYALASKGNDLWVGAPGREVDAAAGAGSVYHYVVNGTAVDLVRIIRPPAPTTGGGFGTSLTIENNRLAVGETGCARPVPAGCVHVYDLGAPETAPRTFSASQGAAGDRLGESVLMAHDMLFAGAIGVDSPSGSTWSGAVYAFNLAGTESHEQLIMSSPVSNNPRFGSSLLKTPDGILIGAPTLSRGGYDAVGALFAAEFDRDEDGISDRDERDWTHTDPNDPDTDDDGLNDGEETWTYGTDPLDTDTDDDALVDGEEVLRWSTNPTNPDTDADGLEDGREVLDTGTNPLDFDSEDDGLGDGVEVDTYGSDPFDADTDGDRFSDQYEVATGSDPTNPWDVPIAGAFYAPPGLDHPTAEQWDDEDPLI